MAERKGKKTTVEVQKRPRGAPSTYSVARAKTVLDQIACGVTLAEICRQPGMPGYTTVWEWKNAHPEFAEAYARAREVGFDVLAEGCLAIADDGTNDYMQEATGDGAAAYRLNGEHVQRSKLRIWTRLELLKRWDPKRYGELTKIDMTVTNPLAERLARAKERLDGK